MAGDRKRKSQGLNGLNSLAYMGQNTAYAPDTNVYDRDPTIDDHGLAINDLWTNYLTEKSFILVKREIGNNIWEPITGAVQTITAGNNITATTVGDIVTVGLTQGTNKGEILIANTATGVAEWSTLTEGANISITNDDGEITIASAAGPGGDITFDCDTNTATSDVGTIELAGTTGRITTTGDLAHKVTLDIGSDVALKTDLTDYADTYTTDTGNATPVAGVLNVLGGQNTNTSAAGNSVTVNVNDTYQVAVDPATLEIGTVDATQKLGSVSIADLKVMLGLP